MVKGAQKQMVVVKINDSEVFEEAYFMLRRGAGGARMDMLAEANRIVEESGVGVKKKRRISVRAIMIAIASFFTGGALGALIVGLVGIMS